VTVTGLAVNTAVTVEFNTGTLGRVQLEIGSVATPLEKPDPRYDLANCQRFFQTGQVDFNTYGVAALVMSTFNGFPVTMRAGPTIAYSGASYGNASGITAVGYVSGLKSYITVTTTGGANASAAYTASADL
jgi:hypothetical protein